MGFLDDLIKTVQEAAEEARAQQRQRKSSSEWTPGSTEPMATAKERQVARVVRRQREPQESPEPQPHAHHAHHAKTAPSTVPPRPRQQAAGAERLRRLLQQPSTLRELMMLREILDPPLALRRARGGIRRPGRR